jgi:hypothetical protein
MLAHIGAGALSGVTLGVWLRILRDTGFSIDPPYWPRALITALGCVPNSVIAALERRRFGRQITDAQVKPPLFVLGIWRSGTTYLHNLLCQDQRFAFPSFYHCLYPHTFLCTERAAAPLLAPWLPRTRPQDNVRLGVGEAQEEELALCALTGRSLLLALAFPRNAPLYDRYLTLDALSEPERAEWKAAFVLFLKKLSFRDGRPLVLKSPGHTGRIKLLLELFPAAKFVHIHRNPYEVFQSARHAVTRLAPWWALQRHVHNEDVLNGRVIRQYREAYEAFFSQRHLIPHGQFHEVRFDDLESDSVREMRALYRALDLPNFKAAEAGVHEYVKSLAGYRKNIFPPLPADLRRQIAAEWARCFDEWSYPR